LEAIKTLQGADLGWDEDMAVFTFSTWYQYNKGIPGCLSSPARRMGDF
jgi:hypothetical protein